MRSLQLIALTGTIGLLIFAAGCGSEKAKQQDETEAAAFDTIKVTYDGLTAVGVTHAVKDYKDWLKTYIKVSDPESRVSIFASPEDENLITVFELTKSHNDARKFIHSDELKKAMDEAGVISEPVYHFYDVKFRVNGTTEKKYRLGVTHEVADFEKWKKVFDEDEPVRTKANLELRAISLDADNPHIVNILFATDDIDKAKEVINSDELRKKMTEAGVSSEPVFSVFKVPE